MSFVVIRSAKPAHQVQYGVVVGCVSNDVMFKAFAGAEIGLEKHSVYVCIKGVLLGFMSMAKARHRVATWEYDPCHVSSTRRVWGFDRTATLAFPGAATQIIPTTARLLYRLPTSFLPSLHHGRSRD